MLKLRLAQVDETSMRTQVNPHKSVVSRPRCSGFSLVELVIVVVIIGVVAAIVVPRVSGASERSKQSALAGNLAMIQACIDRYTAEHQGLTPSQKADGSEDSDSTNFIARLTQTTDVSGTLSSTGIFGPYLRAFPVNPYTRGATLLISATVTGGDYKYDPTTGKISADQITATVAGGGAMDEGE